jgi:hypothetical protein
VVVRVHHPGEDDLAEEVEHLIGVIRQLVRGADLLDQAVAAEESPAGGISRRSSSIVTSISAFRARSVDMVRSFSSGGLAYERSAPRTADLDGQKSGSERGSAFAGRLLRAAIPHPRET